MHEYITLGVVDPDGNFTSSLTRKAFLQPLMLNGKFLSGSVGPLSRHVNRGEDERQWPVTPSEGGFVLVDFVESQVFDWTLGSPLSSVEATHLGFGRNPQPYGAKLRANIRPYVVAANYFTETFDLVRREIATHGSDRDFVKQAEAILYEGHRRTMFFKPSTQNIVTFEVRSPVWDWKNVPFHDPSGFATIRNEIEQRVPLADSDRETWDVLQGKIERGSSFVEAWNGMRPEDFDPFANAEDADDEPHHPGLDGFGPTP